jgi:hypothetical protein
MGLISLTIFPAAIEGVCFPLRTSKRPITVDLVSFIVFHAVKTGDDFPLRTSKKAYYRGFGQLNCISCG